MISNKLLRNSRFGESDIFGFNETISIAFQRTKAPGSTRGHLAYPYVGAGTALGIIKGNGNNQGQNGGNHVVPETNTGIVLIPLFGAVLLFSSLRFLRSKAAQK